MKLLLYYKYKHIFNIDLLALSIPSTVFLSPFLMIAFCTCYVGLYDIIIDSIWNTNRKCLKENLNLHVFGLGDYCNFLYI